MLNTLMPSFWFEKPKKEAPVAPVAPKAQPPKREVSMKHFLTGAIAGAVSRSATCPLERLKILRQTSVKSYAKLSLDQAMMKIYRKEGIIGFYKGNGVNVFRASP